ncbi:coiled-coil domain-containing protein [Tsukamurella soli]|uniref:hypothetical protein n=1 Tax=Tsukamurella soli TaxID=644556 RepID=UPI0036088AC1
MANSDSSASTPAPFAVALRGYDRDQVNQTFHRYQSDLRLMSADRDAAAAHARELTELLDDAQDEIDNLRREVDRLSVPPTTAEGMSDRIARMMRLASDEASEIRAQAESEAAETRSLAQQEADTVRREAEALRADMVSRRAQMEEEHTTTLQAAKDEARRIVDEAKAHAEHHDRTAQNNRERVQTDFDLAMSLRRDRAISTITELEDASKREARERIDAANERAEHVVSAANATAETVVEDANTAAAAQLAEARRVTEDLQQIRTSILQQLEAVREQLERVPGQLAPGVAEDERLAQALNPASVRTAPAPRVPHVENPEQTASQRARTALTTADFEPASAQPERQAPDGAGSTAAAARGTRTAARPAPVTPPAADDTTHRHEARSLDDESPATTPMRITNSAD